MVYNMPTYSSLSQVPGTAEYHAKRSYIRGQGFIHVPGQVGTYSEWMDGGAERKALFNAQKAAAYEWAYPYATGGMDYSKSLHAALSGVTPIPTQSPTRVMGTTASRAAGIGIAAGGTALARGGPSLGVAPGAGLSLVPAGGNALGSVTTSLSGIQNRITTTATELLPLATKVVVALLAIKIILWLVRKK